MPAVGSSLFDVSIVKEYCKSSKNVHGAQVDAMVIYRFITL